MVEALFVGAIVGLGGGSGDGASKAYARSTKAYEGRAYHNLSHVEAVLKTYLQIAGDLSAETGSQITLALCYHDVVYDPRAKDNESRSADYADGELALLGISVEDRAEISRLILLTQRHDVAAEDTAGAIVVDADLAVLQSSPEEYDRYAAAIREEYAWVPENDYRIGRTSVLESLLKKKLFASPVLDEAAAQANIRREMATLVGGFIGSMASQDR